MIFSDLRKKLYINAAKKIRTIKDKKENYSVKYKKILTSVVFMMDQRAIVNVRTRKKLTHYLSEIGGLTTSIYYTVIFLYRIFAEPFSRLHKAVTFADLKTEVLADKHF